MHLPNQTGGSWLIHIGISEWPSIFHGARKNLPNGASSRYQLPGVETPHLDILYIISWEPSAIERTMSSAVSLRNGPELCDWRLVDPITYRTCGLVGSNAAQPSRLGVSEQEAACTLNALPRVPTGAPCSWTEVTVVVRGLLVP